MTDLIIHQARLRTMTDPSGSSLSPLTALAVVEGTITRVGTDEEILALRSADTEVIDAQGMTLTPGLIDSHAHPVLGAEATMGADLGGLTDVAAVREALARAAADLPADAWVRGWNLDYKVFSEEELHGRLFEEAVGGRPMLLIFFDMHTGLANTAALERVAIDGSESFDDGSEIVLDDQGVPTGELREIPAYLKLLDAAPAGSGGDIAARVQDQLLTMAASGVTRSTVMDGRLPTLRTLELAESLPGGLPVELHVALWHQPGDDDDVVQERIAFLGTGGQRYRVSMIKMFIDGVIDAGTAWLHAPDAHGDSTEPFWHSLGRFAEVAGRYHRAGFQLTTHSCGDAGVAHVAGVYRDLGEELSPHAPFRIEHLETLTDADIRALVDARIVASMQPLHMQWREADDSDPWAERLGAERAARAWRIRDILAAGGRVALGSDWPVASGDARYGMAWTRLRREPGSAEAPEFQPDQRLTAGETLLGYTRWAAEALGRADLGVIEEGTVADLALWSGDPVDVTADELPDLPVELTVLGGKIAYRR